MDSPRRCLSREIRLRKKITRRRTADGRLASLMDKMKTRVAVSSGYKWIRIHIYSMRKKMETGKPGEEGGQEEGGVEFAFFTDGWNRNRKEFAIMRSSVDDEVTRGQNSR
jgi:hypothetical protein